MNDKKKTPFERLSRVIKRTEIKDVFLKKSYSECFVHFSDFSPTETTVKQTQKHAWQISENKKKLGCSIDYKIVGHKIDTPEMKLFEIDCIFHVEYSIDEFDSLEKKDLSVFVNTNAYYNAYSYIRQHVQNECITMRIPPLVLPFLKPLTKTTINSLFQD